MYKVVSEHNHNEVWATGFFDKNKAQERIDSGYFHRYMYTCDKHKKLIVIEANEYNKKRRHNHV